VTWEIMFSIFKIPRWLVPKPSDIYLSFINDAKRYLLKHTLITLQEILLGFTIGASVGALLGLIVSYSDFMRRVVYPLAIFIKVIPIIAIAPLLTIWFGFGIWSKVAIIIFITFFPLFISTIVGLRSVDPCLLDLMNSISASKLQVLFKVRLPMALPYIFAALKIAITSSVIGAVIGEFVGATSGLGSMLLIAQSYMDTPLMFVMLITLAILGLSLFGLVCIAERIVIPWSATQESQT
jgi:NitT/TauT family transport system permease protein